LSARLAHTNEGGTGTVVLVLPALVDVVVLYAAQEKDQMQLRVIPNSFISKFKLLTVNACIIFHNACHVHNKKMPI
jgi:hypothetical protein